MALALLVVLALFVGFERPEPAFGDLTRPLADGRQGWAVNVPTNVMPGSTIRCEVEIPGPPPPTQGDPPFKTEYMINGWSIGSVTAHYDYELGVWVFDIVVPPGSGGATLKVWVHPENTDIPSTSTERKIG